ncbi:hypothetical protein [Salinarimonas soli]|uniref:Uncharacterized protein n=1 Tax=Salinarimonas soli TaxID=1638099 RepID=A0A5B2VVX9_9HYPH|nr:hypothetical protein [Salinarimonas soli]KAA2242179.1 hypothetical protein F0L46_02500 [Salinarimonas soli]
MSSPPVNVNNRAAIERVLEKTLEETQRDLAAFLKARTEAPTLDPRQNDGRNREQPREPDTGAQARLKQAIREQEALDASRRASRLVAPEPVRPATPRREAPARQAPVPQRPDAAGLVPGRTPRQPITPQAFATPGLVPNPLIADDRPVAGTGAPRVSPAGSRNPAPVAPPAPVEPSRAERLLAERRPVGDWPPIPADMRVAPTGAAILAPAPGGPRLSAVVPRKVQDRIDEFYRTGVLNPEPFRFDPVDPLPVVSRAAPMPRSGLAASGPSDAPRAMPEPPRLRLVAGTMA